MNRHIKSKFEMRDGTFGISLNLNEHLPKQGCEAVEIYVIKENEKEHHGIFLPHQLYLENLLEWTENKKYQIYFKPHYPEQQSIAILEEENE